MFHNALDYNLIKIAFYKYSILLQKYNNFWIYEQCKLGISNIVHELFSAYWASSTSIK